jgi:hypothetical protein
MFAVYCPGHRGRILLFAEHIEQLVNRASGVELHWRCSCGSAGIQNIVRAEASLVEAA